MDPAEARLRPEQRTFNRLVADIEKARKALADWVALEDALDRRISADLMPAAEALKQAQRTLVLALDRLLTEPSRPAISNKNRRVLQELLGEMIDQLTADGADEELSAIYDRHHAESLAERREIEAKMATQIFGEMARDAYGDEFEVGDAHDDPAAFAERVAAAEQQRQQRERSQEHEPRARRGESAGKPARGKLAQSAQEISQSLREVYRKLASSLHPDRELDPTERARKTELMQQANRAYESRDLLTLLRLQMDLEQINGARLATLPAALVRHYNEVLREQLQALRTEIDDRAAGLSERVFVDHWKVERDPRAYSRALDREIRDIRLHTRSLGELVRELFSPGARAVALKHLVEMAVALRAERARQFDAEDYHVDEWADESATSHAPKGKKRKR